MMGFIEWRSKEGWAMERAIVTRCIAEQGIYRVEFASGSTLSEGLLEFTWGAKQQKTIGKYGYTDGSYAGEAEVIGHATETPELLEFTGTWHDSKDGTGEWDLYVAIEDAPGQNFTFKYDDPDISSD